MRHILVGIILSVLVACPLAAHQGEGEAEKVRSPTHFPKAIQNSKRPNRCDCDFAVVARFLAVMLNCRTAKCVLAFGPAVQQAGPAARLAYNSRLLAVDPSNRSAALGLLRDLPVGSAGSDTLSNLGMIGTPLWEGETPSQMIAAEAAYNSLTRQAAAAVALYPRFLPRFLQYGILAVGDPHDTFGDWAARVCRSNPKRFLKAFRTLSEKDQQYIAKHVIQPEGCKQIAFPEAE